MDIKGELHFSPKGGQFSCKYEKLVYMLKGEYNTEFNKLKDYLKNFDKELEYANSCKG